MKLSPQAEKVFFTNPPKVFEGDGFAVHVFFPYAIRYLEPNKVLTVSAEPQILERLKSPLLPRFLKILTARTWVEVLIEEPVYWDNSAERPSTPEELIVARIEESLKNLQVTFSIKRAERLA